MLTRPRGLMRFPVFPGEIARGPPEGPGGGLPGGSEDQRPYQGEGGPQIQPFADELANAVCFLSAVVLAEVADLVSMEIPQELFAREVLEARSAVVQEFRLRLV